MASTRICRRASHAREYQAVVADHNTGPHGAGPARARLCAAPSSARRAAPVDGDLQPAAAAHERAGLALRDVGIGAAPAAARRPPPRPPVSVAVVLHRGQDLVQLVATGWWSGCRSGPRAAPALPTPPRPSGAAGSAASRTGSASGGPDLARAAAPRARWPATGPKTSRAWKVAETSGGTGRALVISCTRGAAAARASTKLRSPLSGPTKR